MDTVPEPLKIVVADDSPIYRKLLQNALAPDQHTVFVAKNGQEALALVAEHQPALVVTDWEMPDVTGVELCRRIRCDQTPYIYVILLTSNTQKEQLIEGLGAGADDYLTKPFHAGELLARVAVGRRIYELHREIRDKNLMLEELALSDPLTGIPNRRALEGWALRELSSAERHGYRVWVVMADLDNFKNINDKHGHDAGDVVLKKFGEVLRANTRASNICARLGGEEFVIVLSHIDRRNVETAVERVRQQFAAVSFCFNGLSLRPSASFGVAGTAGIGRTDFSALLGEADQALYLAKKDGKNCVRFARDVQALC